MQQLLAWRSSCSLCEHDWLLKLYPEQLDGLADGLGLGDGPPHPAHAIDCAL